MWGRASNAQGPQGRPGSPWPARASGGWRRCWAAMALALACAAPAAGQPSPPQSAPAGPAADSASAATACPPTAAPLSADALQAALRSAPDRGLLWEARRQGRTVWLYGTVHAARREWMFPGPQLQAALRSADRVALELDMLDPAIARRLQAAVAARADEPALPPALARRMAAQAALACLGDALANLRPEMQAMTLVALAGRQAGLDPAYGVDGFLAGLARGLGKPVISLETPESQIQVLVSADRQQRDALIDDSLRELESGQAVPGLLRLTQAWADGRLDELANYGQWCHCLDTPAERDLHERLIQRRNGPLARRAIALHEAHAKVFVAVGALHMVGPDGLPALLAQAGFEVRRVALSGDRPAASPRP